jgi:hypothetical protein
VYLIWEDDGGLAWGGCSVHHCCTPGCRLRGLFSPRPPEAMTLPPPPPTPCRQDSGQDGHRAHLHPRPQAQAARPRGELQPAQGVPAQRGGARGGGAAGRGGAPTVCAHRLRLPATGAARPPPRGPPPGHGAVSCCFAGSCSGLGRQGPCILEKECPGLALASAALRSPPPPRRSPPTPASSRSALSAAWTSTCAPAPAASAS